MITIPFVAGRVTVCPTCDTWGISPMVFMPYCNNICYTARNGKPKGIPTPKRIGYHIHDYNTYIKTDEYEDLYSCRCGKEQWFFHKSIVTLCDVGDYRKLPS